MMGDSKLVKTPFDNNRTLLYKWALSQKIPTRLVIVRRRPPGARIQNLEPESQTFESLRNFIRRLDTVNFSLVQTYTIIKDDAANNLKDQDIIMIWFEKMRDAKKKNNEELLLELNNWNLDRVRKDLVYNVDELESYFMGWKEEIQKAFKRDFDYTENVILTAEKELSKYEPVLISDLNTRSSTLTIKISNRNGSEITLEDSNDIFNESKVSAEVPFISYLENTESEKYLNKIYVSPFERLVNWDKIIFPRSILRNEDTLYLNIYKSSNDIDLLNAQPEDFIRPIPELSIKTKELSLFSTPETVEKILSRVSTALPTIKLEEATETYITGDFYVFGVELYLPSFLDIILRESLFRLYIFVDEMGQPQALKQRLNMKYRSGAFIETEESETKDEERFSVAVKSVAATRELKHKLFDSDKTYTVKAKEKYLQFTINRASNYTLIQEFLRIFRYLLGAYQVLRFKEVKTQRRGLKGMITVTQDSIETTYRKLFPNIPVETGLTSPREEKEEKKGTRNTPGKGRSKGLASEAPEIFQHISRYGTKCQVTEQPIIINPENIPEWTEQTFIHKGKTYNRQILPFPPKVISESQKIPENYFGCDNPEFPFPGVNEFKKKPKDPEGELPIVPCCFKSDRTEEPGYQKYYEREELPTEKISGSTKRIHTKSLILNPYHVGYLPPDLQNLLKKYIPNEEWTKDRFITRLGVPTSTSSFLHCVCEAIHDEGYLELKISEREKYVRELRSILTDRVPVHVVNQELWDLSETEIKTRIRNFGVFFDPLLFYRLLEEYFNINIYIFGFESDSNTKIEIPRHKFFHATAYRPQRPTVLLMRHRGTLRETKLIPQCELIVDYDMKNGTAIKVFPEKMTEIVHTISVLNNNVITFSFDDPKKLVGRSRIYNYIDPKHKEKNQEPYYQKLIKGGVGSWIDGYGKMRAIVFQHNGRAMTMAGLPAQPENLPLIAVDDLPDSSFTDAVEVFGSPSGLVRNSKNEIIGLWYSIFDIPFGVYVPVKRNVSDKIELVDSLNQLPNGPSSPLSVIPGPALERLRYLRKLASIIQQLVEYLFDIYRIYTLKAKEKINAEFFIKNYLGFINGTGDPLNHYEIRKLPRSLPDSKSVEEALEKLSTLMPTFFTKEKLVLFNSELFRKISFYTNNYHKETEGLELDPKIKLNIFLDEEDFIQSKFSNIFLSEKDLELWIKSQVVVNVNLSVLTKLDLSKAQSLSPYLYKRDNGQIYLVQNVIGGDVKRALRTSINWFNNKINIGSGKRSDKIDDKDVAVVHAVYGIDPGGSLKLIVDNTKGTQNYVEIIYYGANIGYGSLLPLLS